MDITVITDTIANLGFPIAVCCALFWKLDKQDIRHKEEIDLLRTSLEANTEVLTKMYERLIEGEKHEKRVV